MITTQIVELSGLQEFQRMSQNADHACMLTCTAEGCVFSHRIMKSGVSNSLITTSSCGRVVGLGFWSEGGPKRGKGVERPMKVACTKKVEDENH